MEKVTLFLMKLDMVIDNLIADRATLMGWGGFVFTLTDIDTFVRIIVGCSVIFYTGLKIKNILQKKKEE